MTTQAAVAIFGYNNTRLYDVKMLQALVHSRLGAELLLIKQDITLTDLEVTPHCFDHAPEDPDIVAPLRAYLADKQLGLIACLPFSDKGVIGAAHVARAFGLVGDEVDSAPAMLDKAAFRRLEAGLTGLPASYKRPFFHEAHTVQELRDRLDSEGAYFIKPKAEGNSRGCMKITGPIDLERWLQENAAVLPNGVILEEILSDDREYSFDGVAGRYWITEKFTTRGAYRAEYQHIMPAPLSPAATDGIHAVLEPLLRRLGSRRGAFHHEFFRLADGRIASVEPNRRPAGMWLWDLAGLAFAGFRPWELWVDHCAGRMEAPTSRPLATCFAGVRAVIVPSDGTLVVADERAIEAALRKRFGSHLAQVSLLKRPGDRLRCQPRDNSDFVAFIAMTSPDYQHLRDHLDAAHDLVLAHLEVQSCAST